jgi:hypothetical protein
MLNEPMKGRRLRSNYNDQAVASRHSSGFEDFGAKDPDNAPTIPTGLEMLAILL